MVTPKQAVENARPLLEGLTNRKYPESNGLETPPEGVEPVAWLIKAHKPGTWSEWATVDPEDSVWWPADQGWTDVTLTPLVEGGPPVSILPEKWRAAPQSNEVEGFLAEARKALQCLYLATEPDIARDVGAKVEAAFAALAKS